MPSDLNPQLLPQAKTPTESQQKETKILQLPQIYFLSSVTTGIISTGLFNPIDRALYLAVINKRSFLTKANFVAPYQGGFQAMIQKCIFGSLYFIAQDTLKTHLHPYMLKQLKTSETTANLSIGTLAGSINGVLSNPVAAIKYRTWGDDKRKFIPTSREMWKAGKLKPFIRGTRATVYREMAFGGIYVELGDLLHKTFTPLNSENKPCGLMTLNFATNTLSAILATIAASPFNFARNIQYNVPPQEKAPTVKTVLNSVYQESKTKSKTLLGQAGFFAKTFQVGWGTARAGFGMAAGQLIFDASKKGFTQCVKPKI